MYAEFTEDLVTGNEMIDSQHKELIEKINALLRSCENGSDQITAIKTLDFLSDYTTYHFGEEEKLQREIEYPGYSKHILQHKAFIETVESLHQMLIEEEGPSPAFVECVQENVVKWLYTHIHGFDRSVAEYKYMRDNNTRL